MVAALFDTNILIDHLNAVPEAREEIALYDSRAISIVTWIEVMAGAKPHLVEPTRSFLRAFEIIGLDDEIAARSVELRRDHRIRLPDAVIWATAQIGRRLLVTRNVRDFPADDPGIREPYRI